MHGKIKWVWACVVLLFVIMTVGCYAGFHCFRSVNENDTRGLEKQAAAYLQQFSGFDNAEIRILKTDKRGGYLAALCRSDNRRYYACIFERDRLFPDRWHVNGGGSSDPGEISSWNMGTMGSAVLCFYGAELPDDAVWYAFHNSDITYICPIHDSTALNLFVIPDSTDISGVPELLNAAQQKIM